MARPEQWTASDIDSRVASEVCKKVGAFFAKNAGFTGATTEAYGALADIVESYLETLVTTSHAYAELACRTKPNLNDLERTFRRLDIRTGALEGHVEKCKAELYRQFASNLRSEFRPASPLIKPLPDMLPSDDEVQGDEMKGLHSQKTKKSPSTRPAYVPLHMPAFPSKHSYKNTPVYPNCPESDPKRFRKLNMEHVRMMEQNLQKLIAVEDQVFFPSVAGDSTPSSSTVVSSSGSSVHDPSADPIPVVNYETFTLRNLAKKNMRTTMIKKPWENVESIDMKRRKLTTEEESDRTGWPV